WRNAPRLTPFIAGGVVSRIPMRYTLPCATAGDAAAQRASATRTRRLTTGAVFLPDGDDPVEPRRSGGHEQAGDRHAGDRQQDREEDQRDRRDREVEELVHHSTSRIIS